MPIPLYSEEIPALSCHLSCVPTGIGKVGHQSAIGQQPTPSLPLIARHLAAPTLLSGRGDGKLWLYFLSFSKTLFKWVHCEPNIHGSYFVKNIVNLFVPIVYEVYFNCWKIIHLCWYKMLEHITHNIQHITLFIHLYFYFSFRLITRYVKYYHWFLKLSVVISLLY